MENLLTVMAVEPPSRVVAYIDGFNLYKGLKDSGWERYLWLNLRELVESNLPNNSLLSGVNYFTTRIVRPEDKRIRQNTYIEALEQLPDVKLHYGKFLFEEYYCPHCYSIDNVPKEKMTDVNIAVQMIADAFENRFDVAMLISGDTDLVPPVATVRRLFPEKRVIVAFPPKRQNAALEPPTSSHSFVIARAKFARSQFPPEIIKADGYTLKRPNSWR